MILDPDGDIVTNAHVVLGARRVQVQLVNRSNDRSILSPHSDLLGAQVVRMDLETDLAVLKVAERNLPHLTLAQL